MKRWGAWLLVAGAALGVAGGGSRAQESDATLKAREAQRKIQESSLLRAVKAGDLPEVERLLYAGVDPNAPTAPQVVGRGGGPFLPEAGPIQSAAFIGRVDILRALLKAGADPTLKGVEEVNAPFLSIADETGWTPLGWVEKAGLFGPEEGDAELTLGHALGAAALEGHLEAVKVLVEEARISPDDHELSSEGKEDGWTPLIWATIGQHEEVVDYLLSQRANPSLKEQSEGRTALHFAALMRNPAILAKLLKAGGEASSKDALGRTPLHIAAGSGSEACVKLLLASGAQCDARSEALWTPLHSAAANGQSSACELLLGCGAEVDARDAHGRTALDVAAAGGFDEACLVLLASGASPMARDELRLTPLHFAAAAGDVNTFMLLYQAGSEVNARDALGYAPLHYAAWADSRAVAALLLLRGAKVDARGEDGMTPLHVAALECSLDVTSLLLVLGADPDLRDDLGWTPAHYAAAFLPVVGWGTPEDWKRERDLPIGILSRLILYGAQVDSGDDRGSTPLHVACGTYLPGMVGQGAESQVEYLIKKGADVRARDRAGRTPLDVALESGSWSAQEAVRAAGGPAGSGGTPRQVAQRLSEAIYMGDEKLCSTLLDAGADPNVRGWAGTTPLLLALDYGKTAIARLLLERGADAKLSQEDGYSVCHALVQKRESELLPELLDHGADVNVIWKYGGSPLLYAARRGATTVALALLDSGAAVDIADARGRTALHFASFAGDGVLASRLLGLGADPDARATGGLTPLAAAAMVGNTETAEMLHARGARDGAEREVALWEAVKASDVKAARRLLAEGADPEICGLKGRSLAHVAVGNRSRELVELLSETGKRLNYRDDEYHSPLDLALGAITDWVQEEEEQEFAQFYIRNGGLPTDEEGRKLGLEALGSWLEPREIGFLADAGVPVDGPPGVHTRLMRQIVDRESAPLLLNLGADPRRTDGDGGTALHYAANGFEGTFSQENVELLIAAGADVNAQDNDGRTPAHQAAIYRRIGMLESLARAGANLDRADHEGKTPLDYALEAYDMETATWLRRRIRLQKAGVPN